MTADARPRAIDIVEQIDGVSDRETVAMRDVVGAFGTTAFIPILMVPALLVVSPLSGIPFFSSICGIAIAVVSAQILLGRKRVWLPEMLLRRQIAGERLHDGAERMKRVARWIDRHTHDRLLFLTSWTQRPVVFGACMVSGLAMPLLEVVPFSSSILGSAVLCFATGMLSRDGLFVLGGYALMGMASLIPMTVYFGVT